MARLTFFNRNRVDEYEQDSLNFKKRLNKFSVFVIAALLIVTIIIGSMFYVNYKNNSLYMFIDASASAFNSGSFDYHVTASIDSKTYMDYTGQMMFSLDDQTMTSVYHAKYEDYEYDSVIYSKKDFGYSGTYYGGKWTINDYTTTSLDFFDFFRSYNKKEFNAAAFMRFMGNTKTFDAYELETSVNNIFSELSSVGNLSSVMHQDIASEDDNTIVTFKPELDKVFDIIVENIAPAYSSANEYKAFKEMVNNNQENLKNTKCEITYTINADGLLTDVTIDYTVNGKNYVITCELSNFKNAKVTVPDGFFVAADIQA